jgi:hypothetical protein
MMIVLSLQIAASSFVGLAMTLVADVSDRNDVRSRVWLNSLLTLVLQTLTGCADSTTNDPK